jgi:hypothetical protein
MSATVVNVCKDAFDVYIGRDSKRFGAGGKFANPFWMRDESQREKVIEDFRRYLWEEIKTGKITKEELLALDGKRLGCYCHPKKCHGDVLVAAIEWAKKQ